MAGYIIKAIIEDTHPPVWRRILIPDKINFKNLHEILQTVFHWENVHLHEFTFPGSEGRVVMKGQNDVETAAEEEWVSIDGFFHICKWIRYSYDFGDDWRHKLVIEKKDTDYAARTAMVIKYKGDSFEEDSGGVWGNQGSRIPFDVKQVNRKLLDMSFPVQEESEEERQFLDLMQIESAWRELGKKGRKAIRNAAQIMLNKLEKELPKRTGDKKASKMYRRVQCWVNFCEYERRSGELLKNVSQRSSKELLADLHLKGIQEYCKYIGIKPVNMEDIFLCAQAVWKELEQHPEYLAYIFYGNELKLLMELLQAPNGVCGEVPDQEMVTKALALGFFDLTEEYVNRNRYLVLRQTSEAKELMSRYTQAEWKRISKKYRRQIANCNQLLNLYTMMELEVFCQKYQEYYDKSAKREDILRSIYLGGTFCKEIMTAETQEGVSYVAENPVDMNRVLFIQRDLGVEVEYRDFSTQERKMSLYGFGELYPVWGECYKYVTREYGMDNKEAEEWLEPLFYDVKSGRGADRLWERLQRTIVLDDMEGYVTFWNYFIGVCLTTGIPQFKGYSREEYGKIAGISSSKLGVYENLKPVDRITKGTHLYEMPLDFQMRIYEVVSRSEGRRGAEKLEMLLQELDNGNYELEYILGGACLYDQDYKKAEKYFQNIQKAYPKDEHVKEILKNIKLAAEPVKAEEFTIWDMMDGKQPKADVETYRRTQPKIGRNDPCPCGSGKKYKKCCGR